MSIKSIGKLYTPSKVNAHIKTNIMIQNADKDKGFLKRITYLQLYVVT